jgi:hypothetical protein
VDLLVNDRHLTKAGRSATTGRPRKPVRAFFALLTALTATLFLAGCGMNQGPRYTEEELRSRPTFEVADSNYFTMLIEIRAELSVIVPSLEWRTTGIVKEPRGCEGDFGNLYAASNYYMLTADGRIPEEKWPEALAAVERISRQHGFKETMTMAGAPSTTTNTNPTTAHRHDVSIFDSYDARLAFSTNVNTLAWLWGACFLPEEYWTLPPLYPEDDFRSNQASRSEEASRSREASRNGEEWPTTSPTTASDQPSGTTTTPWPPSTTG